MILKRRLARAADEAGEIPMNGNGPRDIAEVRVGRLLARPGEQPCLHGATITFENGRIASVAASGDPHSAGEGKRFIALPALTNPHDHGRGLRVVAIGAKDQMFELWRPALYALPPLDPYLNGALAFGRLARAGVGSVMMVYSSIHTDRLLDDAVAICRAARDVGIRLSFVVPMRDQLTLGYETDDALIARHDPRDRDLIRSTWLYPFPSPQGYMDVFRAVATACEGPMVTIQYGPNSFYSCSDALHERVAAESAADGRRIQLHLLETRAQREFADATYKDGLLRHMDRLGLLSPRFSGAHGVWLRPDDCELLAERGAAIAVNTSSNFRLRSGIAPVGEFIRAGLDFAIGIDSFSFDDDDDSFRELRITHWLHSPSYAAHPLTPAKLFEAALKTGFRITNNADGYGAVEPGAPADLVLLDYDALAYDAVEGMVDELDLVLTRACNRFVERLYVAGREIVREGKVLGIDMAAVEKELLAQVRSGRKYMQTIGPVLQRSQATLASFFRSGAHRGGA
jgi:cytosine/adenosine deaminase-related metal-dependent hydrolase